jgi:stage II sporulation protein AA (anti-sigma F factor antagonist)
MNHFEKKGKVLECLFEGKLDTINSQQIESEIETVMQPEITDVLFDLKKVEYISSSFLRICIATLRRTGKGHFAIKNASPTVWKVFEIANLANLLSAE